MIPLILKPIDITTKKKIATLLYKVRQQAGINTAHFLEKLIIVAYTVNSLENYFGYERYGHRWISYTEIIDRNLKFIKDIKTIHDVRINNWITFNKPKFYGINEQTIRQNNKSKLQILIINTFITKYNTNEKIWEADTYC